MLFKFFYESQPSQLGDKEPDQLLLEKLRGRFQSNEENDYDFLWVSKTSDVFLINWLQYNDYDVNTTEIALRKSLAWRRENKIDKVLESKPDEYFFNEFPYKLLGYENGIPVYFASLKAWDGRKSIGLGLEKDILHFTYYIVEKAIRDLEEENKIAKSEGRSEIGTFILIGDIEGICLTQFSYFKILRLISTGLNQLQSNYPFFHAKAIGINAPAFITDFVKFLKRFALSSKTFERILIFGQNYEKMGSHLMKLMLKESFDEVFEGKIEIIN